MLHKIKEIERPEEKDFENALALIQENIPESEISDKNQFIEVLEAKINNRLYPDNYHLRVYSESDGVLAVSCGYYISEINMGLIHYLTVQKCIRSRGIGSAMRSDLLTCFDKDAFRILKKPAEGYLGEVKNTNPWLHILEEKHQVFPIDIDYFQPELRSGKGDVKFVLYYQPRNKISDSLTKTDVVEIITSIYKNVYDIKFPNENESFKKILNSVKNKTYITKKVF